MKEKLAGLFTHYMRIPQARPKGLKGGDVTHVWQPGQKAHYPKMFWWMVGQTVALVLLVIVTFPLAFGFIPADLLETINKINSFFNDLAFGFVWDFNLPILPWLGLFFEFITTLPVYYLNLHRRTHFFFIDANGVGSREGIMSIREKYTSWRNIQSITIQRSVIQSFLGLSTILIRPAGADEEDSDDNPKRAIRFMDVENANEIHQLLLERLQQNQAEDPEVVPVASAEMFLAPDSSLADTQVPSADTSIGAACQLLAEARLLRECLKSGGAPAVPGDRERQSA